jgi:ascorbate-specific PTS system EIIC-type component UlaA
MLESMSICSVCTCMKQIMFCGHTNFDQDIRVYMYMYIVCNMLASENVSVCGILQLIVYD